jgi:hypothetical protein
LGSGLKRACQSRRLLQWEAEQLPSRTERSVPVLATLPVQLPSSTEGSLPVLATFPTQLPSRTEGSLPVLATFPTQPPLRFVATLSDLGPPCLWWQHHTNSCPLYLGPRCQFWQSLHAQLISSLSHRSLLRHCCAPPRRHSPRCLKWQCIIPLAFHTGPVMAPLQATACFDEPIP